MPYSADPKPLPPTWKQTEYEETFRLLMMEFDVNDIVDMRRLMIEVHPEMDEYRVASMLINYRDKYMTAHNNRPTHDYVTGKRL